MSTNNENEIVELAQPPDAIDNLFLGDIIDAEGSIDSRPARFWGQMTFYGYIEDSGDLVITRLDRLAVSETLAEPERVEEYQALSLAGPLTLSEQRQRNQGEYELDLQLEYRELKPEPAFEQGRSVFPEVKAQLIWRVLDIAEDNRVTLGILLKTPPSTSNNGWNSVPEVEIVHGFTFSPAERLRAPGWKWAEAGVEVTCKDIQTRPQGWHLKQDWEYELSIIFLIFSKNFQHNSDDIIKLCRTQLQHACKVWWHLCGVKLVAWPNLPQDPANQITVVQGNSDMAETLGCTSDDQNYINSIGHDKSKPKHCVEVCLVDSIHDNTHALLMGCTFPKYASSNRACCLLEINKANNAPYLLAHELGHVLGVNDEGEINFPGSPGSIMDIAFFDSPGGSLLGNTANNCMWYVDGRQRLSDIIKKTGKPGYFFTIDQFP